MMLFELPFQDAQRLFNTLYYTRGGAYSRDFSTHASGGNLLAYAEAEDFHKRFGKSREKKMQVLEIGCGNGNSAASFLLRIKQLDRKNKTNLLARLHYSLADFSSEMLESARSNKQLSKFNISLIRLNAENPSLEKKRFHLIRANELLDDLATQILVPQGSEFREITLSFHFPEGVTKLDAKSFISNLELEVGSRKTVPEKKSIKLLRKSLRGIPRARIPIPIGGAALIKNLEQHLAENGTMDFFDYGFNSEKELLSLQHSIFRTPGALTCFVNFPFLKYFAEKIKLKAKIETQSSFTKGKSAGFYHLRLSK